MWKHNLHEEMANIRDLVDKYPYIAMVRTHTPLPAAGDWAWAWMAASIF